MSLNLRVIGVDPGVNYTGFGVIDRISKKNSLIEMGRISPSKKLNFYNKLHQIYRELTEVIGKFKPDIMAVEEAIYAQNVRTALMMGQARGIALLAGVNAELDIYEYSPKKVKMSVVGNGAASKEQVRFMVTRLLNLKTEPESFDASDALAIAICHLNQNRYRE